MTLAGKISALLSKPQRKTALALLGLMIIGMVLETLGIGLVIPAVALLMESDVAIRYPQLRPTLDALGNPTQAQLITGGMLLLVAIYFIKNVFLAFLAWRQTRFAYDVQAKLSQQLFITTRPFSCLTKRRARSIPRPSEVSWKPSRRCTEARRS